MKKTNGIIKAVAVCAIALLSLNAAAQVPMVRISMAGGNNNLDETVLYYQEGATPDFDSQYDAYKLTGPNPAPSIAQISNNVLMQINGVSPVSQTLSVSIKATTPVTANFTMTASDFAFLPKGTCVKLHDLFTGQTTDMLSSAYSFTLADTTAIARFNLSLTYNDLDVIKQVTLPSCTQQPGELVVQGNSAGPWNVTWKNSAGNTIQTSLNKATPDTLKQVAAGNYFVEVMSVAGCDFGRDSVLVIQPVKPIADFQSQDSICISTGEQLTIQNQSVNADNYFWNFGTGMGFLSSLHPVYNYSDTGKFNVTLIATNQSGCSDTAVKEVKVYELLTTGIHKTEVKKVNFYSPVIDLFLLELYSEGIQEYNAEVFDIRGKLVKMFSGLQRGATVQIEMSGMESGVYILRCSSNGRLINSQTFILN